MTWSSDVIDLTGPGAGRWNVIQDPDDPKRKMMAETLTPRVPHEPAQLIAPVLGAGVTWAEISCELQLRDAGAGPLKAWKLPLGIWAGPRTGYAMSGGAKEHQRGASVRLYANDEVLALYLYNYDREGGPDYTYGWAVPTQFKMPAKRWFTVTIGMSLGALGADDDAAWLKVDGMSLIRLPNLTFRDGSRPEETIQGTICTSMCGGPTNLASNQPRKKGELWARRWRIDTAPVATQPVEMPPAIITEPLASADLQKLFEGVSALQGWADEQEKDKAEIGERIADIEDLARGNRAILEAIGAVFKGA